jgi:Putative phage serine protease XkdF
MEVVINGVRYVEVGPVAKAVDTDLVACRVVKTAAKLRYTLGVAYPAMKEDSAVAQDGHIDFISPEVLEKTAWSWMSRRRDIGLFHKDGMEGHADPVESYIYRGPDWVIASPVDGEDYVVKAGDWMLGSIWDEYGWELVEKGLVRGWSPEGAARRAKPDAERLALLRS